jgi:glycolate dehydrogenase FAD-binding subunit
MDASVSSKANSKSTFESDVRDIVTAKHVRAAEPSDAMAGAQPSLVVEPGNEQELAKVLNLANAAGMAVIPRGGGTKLEWGNRPARADLILSTARINRVIEHAWADLTVSVEAGCTIAKLQETLAKHGQRLALDPLWPERATVGGVLSTNDSGALRLRFGSLRDLVIGATVALADGTVASSGGKVVKNVAGYDLPKLMTGAFGTLGVITRAIFRLHPIPKRSRTFTCVAHDIDEARNLIAAIENSRLAHGALQARFIDDTPNPQVDVLFEATEAGLDAQEKQLKSLIEPVPFAESDGVVWKTREEFYSAAKRNESRCAVAKISCLPGNGASVAGTLWSIAITRAHFNFLIQATGVGLAHLEGERVTLASILKAFRTALEREGGSLVIHHRPLDIEELDTWGNSGDALGLMQAVKRQFDPHGTLNPGRFVGGI